MRNASPTTQRSLRKSKLIRTPSVGELQRVREAAPIRTDSQAPKARVTKIGIERFSKLLRLMRKKGAVSMRELEQELQVSTASVKRDIDFLRDRLECPIEWDRAKRAWVLNDEGRFELPGVWFEASEVFALMMMVQLVDGVQPGLLDELIGPLKFRLRRMLAQGTESPERLEMKVKLIHFAPRKVATNHFQVVAGALLRGRQLRLKYWNREKRESTERVISPLQLVHYRENWLVDAWCHERNALRSFSLEAIQEAEAMDDQAKVVDEEEMRAHFQSGYGIFAGPATHRAVIKFTPNRAQWVSLETWHPDQKSRNLADGSYVLEVPYSNDRELLLDLLRHGPEVEVLEPSDLREKVHKLLEKSAKQYEKKLSKVTI